MTAYQFDSERDWFSHNIPLWTELLKPLDGRPLNILEIGSHEGRSSIWIAENLLSHPKSKLTCLDAWSDNTPWKNTAVEARFDHNVSVCPHRLKIRKDKGRSFNRLVGRNYAASMGQGKQFDIIYVDGCHEGKIVVADFVLCWPLLKVGGILIFDDYLWEHERHYRCPKPAIDSILDLWARDFEVVHKDYQVIVRKLDVKDTKCF